MSKSAEFILQPDKISVVVVEPFGPGFGPLLERLGKEPSLQTVECVSAMDALSVVRNMESCLIIAHVGSAADIVQHLTLLKTLQPQFAKKKVRLLVTSAMSENEGLKKLRYAGCNDIVPAQLSLKALWPKLEHQLKALPQPVTAAATASRKVEDKMDTGPEGAVDLGPPLTIQNDCWTLAGGGARRNSGVWTVKLKGPSPDLGSWVQGDIADSWRWQPQSAENVEKGVWIFDGQMPEYHQRLWHFRGEIINLSFFEDLENRGTKLRLNAKGSLVVAADSVVTSTPVEEPTKIEVPTNEPQVSYVDPLTLKSDFWLLEDRKPKYVPGRWLLKMRGPGAAIGRWESLENSTAWESDAEKWWQWIPMAGEDDVFLKEQGTWLFFGLIPRFLDGFWSFASGTPELGFYLDNKSYGSKCQALQNGVLEVARDSDVAKSALPLIFQSFTRALRKRKKVGVDLGTDETPVFNIKDYPDAAPAPLVEVKAQPEILQPSLSTLALAFLMSELMNRRGLDRLYMSQRYCSCLSSSCGEGIRAELWVSYKGGGRWVCAGTADGEAGRFAEAVQSRGSITECEGQPVVVVPIQIGSKQAGALVLGGLAAKRIQIEYAEAAAQMAHGLMSSFQEYELEDAA